MEIFQRSSISRFASLYGLSISIMAVWSVSLSMPMYYNEYIMRLGLPLGETSHYVGSSGPLLVLSHKSGGVGLPSD